MYYPRPSGRCSGIGAAERAEQIIPFRQSRYFIGLGKKLLLRMSWSVSPVKLAVPRTSEAREFGGVSRTLHLFAQLFLPLFQVHENNSPISSSSACVSSLPVIEFVYQVSNIPLEHS